MNNNEIYKLGYGFSIGDSLDINYFGDKSKQKKGISWETGWDNKPIDIDLIKSIKSRGFKTIKLPITWMEHVSYNDDYSKCTCQDWWIKRCKTIINMVISEGLYCIIDIHHDADWMRPLEFINEDEGSNILINKYKSLWKMICTELSDIDKNMLLFESSNEIGFDNDSGKLNYISFINSFINTIREIDGDATRLLIINGPYADSYFTLNYMPYSDIVQDENIVLSVHVYTPQEFTVIDDIKDKVSNVITSQNMQNINDNNEPSYENNVYFDGDFLGVGNNDDPYFDAYGGEVLVKEYDHEKLSNALNFIPEIEDKYNVKVIITEFGCSSFYRNKDHVYDWYKQVTQFCQEHKIPLMMWNNGNSSQCILRDENMQDRKSIDMEKIIRYYNNSVFDEELPESFRSDSDDFAKQIDEDQSLI